MLDQCRALARYNRWMNDKIYAVAAELSDEERKRDLGAFFRSVHGTLNHLLLADRVWLGRFGAMPPLQIGSLADELFADFSELRRERATTDAIVGVFVDDLTAEKLTETLSYKRGAGVAEHPLWFAVLHMFNHQTHHRGQITTLLSQLGRDPGMTDLIALLRDIEPLPAER